MNEEPKRPTPEQTKAIIDLRKRIEQKEFHRQIVDRFPDDAFYDHFKLSCGHWVAFSYESRTAATGITICFRCVEGETEKVKAS